MAKIVKANGEAFGVPAVVGVKAVGSGIIVELLTPQEILGTSIAVDEDSKIGAPQGYIIDIGPAMDPKYGFKIGDRVVLSGTHTPLPESLSTNGRPLGSVEPYVIKAVLQEKKIV